MTIRVHSKPNYSYLLLLGSCDEGNNACQNGGTCVKYGSKKICSCLKGTEGDLCEDIVACRKESFCGGIKHRECYYNVTKKEAACRCKNSVYDERTKTCRSKFNVISIPEIIIEY